MKDQLAKNRRAACKAAPIADFESYEMLRKLVDKGFERDGILLPSDQQNFSRRQSAIRNVPLRHSKEWYQNAALLYKQIQLHQHRELGGEAATVESLTDSALMRQSYVLAENVVFKGTDDHEASFEEALNKIRQSLVLKGRKSRTTLGAEDLNKYKEETLPGLVESYKDFGIVPADVFRRGRTLTTFCKAFNAVADYQDLRERGSNLATAHTYLRRLSKDRNIALEMKGELALDDLNDTRYVSAEVARSLQNAYGTLRQGSFRDVEPEQLPAYLRSVQDTVASIKTHNGATIMDLEGDDVVQTTYKFKRPARFEIGNVSLTRPVEYEKALEKVVEATSD
jgi:hypothetical protein